MTTVNTKKQATQTLENMITKAKFTLLSRSPKAVKEFDKILDRSKREIAAARGKDSDLKRVYAVETEARYNLLVKVLGTSSLSAEDLTKKLLSGSADLSTEEIRMFMLFRDVDLDGLFTQEEQNIFADLNEADMKENIYLGVDCTKAED